MAAAFGFPDLLQSDLVALDCVYGTFEAGMPLDNLIDPQPGTRTRFIPTLDKAVVVIDLGQEVQVGVIAVVNTTAYGGETLTIRGSTTDPTGVAGDAIPATTISSTDPDRSRGQFVKLLAADVGCQYLRLSWDAIGASYFDVGRVVVMPTIRLARGMPFGGVEGRLPSGVRDVNPYTGAEFRVGGLVQRRIARFALPRITNTERLGAVRNMVADATVADDVLWIPDTGLSQEELNLRCILGGIAQPGQEIGITRNTAVSGAMSFSIVERV